MPLSGAGEGAHRHAMQLTRVPLEGRVSKHPEPPAERPHGVGWDKGYDSDEGCDLRRAGGCTAPIRTRGAEAQERREDANKKARR